MIIFMSDFTKDYRKKTAPPTGEAVQQDVPFYKYMFGGGGFGAIWGCQ